VRVDMLVEKDTLLGFCFSIAPRGFVVVPLLKELPPVKVYSEECDLDLDQRFGFPQLLREVLLSRIGLYAAVYGNLDAVQPPTGDVLLGRGHRVEWGRFLKSQQEFNADLRQRQFQPLTEVGPLLTSSWHQSSPYNDSCPMGDGGRCVVGCVATATAQIIKYWDWPPFGVGSHTYYWDGDQSCGGDTDGEWLSADFSDTYDWANMPDSCDLGCTQEQEEALAELNYEVGVAFEMNYGACGSGSWVYKALTVYPNFFRYDRSIDRESRYETSAAGWFSLIQTEINNSRPIQYRISRHSIVCDGWRDTGGQNQYHMNYGWGGSYTVWFSIDSLYCGWEPGDLCPPMEEYMIRNIMPDTSTVGRIDYTPEAFIPYIHVPNSSSVTDTLVIKNIGIGQLNGTLSSSAAWIDLTPTSFGLSSADSQIVEVTLDASGYSDTFLVDSIHISSDDPEFPDIYVSAYLVVSDQYYDPDFALLDNGTIQIYESNVGNIANRVPGGGMYLIADEFDAIYDGAVVLGTKDPTYGSMVGRFVFGDEFMLPETSLVSEEAAGVKLKVTKSKFAPFNPYLPELKWWWTTVEMYDKIFYSGDSDSPERYIKKVHLKIYKNAPPIWWPPEVGSNPEIYAGMAIDFDPPSAYDNTPGYDESLNLLYQQGYGWQTTPTGARYDSIYAGIACHGGTPYGGHVLPNPIYVWLLNAYDDDSLYEVLSTSGFSIRDPEAPRTTDYNSVMCGARMSAGQLDTDTVEIQFLIMVSTGGLQDLKDGVKMFECGNANRDADGAVNLSDVIAMARDYFGSGPETFRFLADVEGDCDLDLSDVLNLANYYFGVPGYELNCECEEEWP